MARTLSTVLLIEKNRLTSDHPWLILLEFNFPNESPLYFVRNTENITFQGNPYVAFPFTLEATKETSKGEVPTLSLQVSNVTRVIQPYLEGLNGGVGAIVKITVVNSDNLSEDYSDLEMEFDILSTTADEKWVTFTLGMSNPLRRKFPNYRYVADHCNWRFDVPATRGVECNYRKRIQTATVWSNGVSYEVGNRVYKTTDSNVTFRCVTAGTSGGSEPTWKETSGVLTTDNSVEWIYDLGCKRNLENCQNLGNSERFGGFIGLGANTVRLV